MSWHPFLTVTFLFATKTLDVVTEDVHDARAHAIARLLSILAVACRLHVWQVTVSFVIPEVVDEQEFSIEGDNFDSVFCAQVKGVAETVGTRPWMEPELERAAWEIFLKVSDFYIFL